MRAAEQRLPGSLTPLRPCLTAWLDRRRIGSQDAEENGRGTYGVVHGRASGVLGLQRMAVRALRRRTGGEMSTDPAEELTDDRAAR